MADRPHIRKGTWEEVVRLSQMLPEFHQPYGLDEYQKRLKEVPHLVLVAEIDGQAVAFKVGYEREADASFYSWVGGVLPPYRRQGLALALAEAQEDWARKQGYRCIRFKTRNRHRAMLIFAINRGFQFLQVEPYPDPAESRIWLEKAL